MMLKPGGASGEGDEALECYAKHTAQIEVTTRNASIKAANKPHVGRHGAEVSAARR